MLQKIVVYLGVGFRKASTQPKPTKNGSAIAFNITLIWYKQQIPRNRFEVLQYRFEVLQSRFEVLQSRFEVLQSRFEVLQSRFEVLQYRFEVLQSRFEVLQYRFEVLQSRFEVLKFARTDYPRTETEKLKTAIAFSVCACDFAIALNTCK